MVCDCSRGLFAVVSKDIKNNSLKYIAGVELGWEMCSPTTPIRLRYCQRLRVRYPTTHTTKSRVQSTPRAQNHTNLSNPFAAAAYSRAKHA